MTDRELLEAAARAAGYTLIENGHDVRGRPWLWCAELEDNWDPLADDGDALRLAVKLGINVTYKSFGEDEVIASDSEDRLDGWFTEPYGENKPAAARRVIVRAAAAIAQSAQK